MLRLTPSRAWRLTAGILLLSSCQDVSSNEVTGISPAKGGGGGGPVDPTVTAISPASTPQDTTLDVRVFGTGFDRGSRADFPLHGVLDPKVKTNSTKYVSATELVANVTIAADAVVAKYDVLVTTSRGRKGVGSELLAVEPGDPKPTFYFPNTAGLGIRGDGVAAYLEVDGTSRYRPVECGVASRIFVAGSGDATLTTDAKRDAKCAAWPRRVRITFYDVIPETGELTPVTSETTALFMNTFHIQNTTFAMPVGGPWESHGLGMNDALCRHLSFRAVNVEGTVTGADSVQVRRTAPDTWEVRTAPPTVDGGGGIVYHDRAYCADQARLYHVPIAFTIRSPVPLPLP